MGGVQTLSVEGCKNISEKRKKEVGLTAKVC